MLKSESNTKPPKFVDKKCLYGEKPKLTVAHSNIAIIQRDTINQCIGYTVYILHIIHIINDNIVLMFNITVTVYCPNI